MGIAGGFRPVLIDSSYKAHQILTRFSHSLLKIIRLWFRLAQQQFFLLFARNTGETTRDGPRICDRDAPGFQAERDRTDFGGIMRIVRQSSEWKLICLDGTEYELKQHNGFSIEFMAANDEDALEELNKFLPVPPSVYDGLTP